MATYAVFEPPLKDQSAGVADVLAHAERFKFVRDGFSWLAFLFTPFWMLFNRLWLAFLCYIILMAAVGVGATLLGIAPGAVTLVTLALALLAGFEASTLRRRKLMWKRWQDRGIVIADSFDTAEQRFFDRWVAKAPPQAVEGSAAVGVVAQPVQQTTAYDPNSYVIGQFPSKEPPAGGNS